MSEFEIEQHFQPAGTFMRYSPGIGELLNSDEMRRAMLKVANDIKHRAEDLALAEIYGGKLSFGGEASWRAGRKHYINGFEVRSHRNGGATNDRAEAILYNDAPSAMYVEFGHRGREPFHILKRAAFGPLAGE
jgi:hypothetical protein